MPDYLPRRLAHMLKSGSSSSAAVTQLIRNADPTNLVLYTHFLGDALPGEWGAAKTNGASAAVTVALSQLTCTTGTDDDGYAGQGFGLFWKGDLGFFFEQRGALSVITAAKLEIGVTDSIADAGAVATKATPTDTADDFCVLVYDTEDNTELDIISTLDNGTCTANAENVHTLVLATNFTTEFRYAGDSCTVFINGDQKGTGSCQGGDLMTPWVFAQTRDASASKVFTSEYWFAFGPDGMT